jgi:hypothetical protein
MNKKKIKNPERFFEEVNNLKDNALSILEKMKDTAETRALKEKLQKCNDIVELLEIVTEILRKALIHMNGKKYLTDDEVESLKAACETSEEQSIVRDLTDNGMTLGEALKRSKFQPNL